MIVHQFTAESEYTRFSERNLTTVLHAHPALEVVIAHEGRFSLATPNARLNNLYMAVVKPNEPHAFLGSDAYCEFIFIEPGRHVFTRIAQALHKPLTGITALSPADGVPISPESLLAWSKEKPANTCDDRVLYCMHIIRAHSSQSALTLAALASKVYLSPSRLSHLFSREMGVPIQRYILWTKLKQSVDYIVHRQMSLSQAAHAAGFYDMAHFSRCFKEMMGVAPSKVYNNSLIVQA
jgi:AraC-like DNA-binding protein